MKSKEVIFIADFFRKDLLGGAESNDSVLISSLRDAGFTVQEASSSSVTNYFILKNRTKSFIISNFVSLPREAKDALTNSNTDYIIYEHDHKYVNTRDPSKFVDFLIPEDKIVNKRFYQRAKKVFVLSEVCKEVIERNLKLDNVHSIGCSLWTKDKFELLQKLSANEKTGTAVLNSNNPTKGTAAAKQVCEHKKINFSLIGSSDEQEFLESLSKTTTLVFIPQVLETFCRLVAEAKMLNCKVLTKPKLIGFASEDCFSLSGEELISEMKNRNKSAIEKFVEILLSEGVEKKKRKIKKAAFIGKFRKLHDEEAKCLALENQGIEVCRFDENTFNKAEHNNLQTILDNEFDAVFFTKLRVPGAQEVIDSCRENNITTICWVPDLYFGLQRQSEIYSLKPIFQADYVLTPDGGNQDKFAELGINHHPVHQAIHAGSCASASVAESEKDVELLFVGSCTPIHGQSRANLLNFLSQEYGEKFLWVGQGNDEAARGDKLTKLIQSAKIVIGDCVKTL